MFLQTSGTTRRKFLEYFSLGAGSLVFSSALLESCMTDHDIPPPPVGGLDPSKGVAYHAYLANGSFSITFQKPIDLGAKTQTVQWPASGFMPQQMLEAGLQISESDIGLTEHTGRFQWHLQNGGVEIAAGSGYAEIAPSTGNLGSSTIGDMLNTPSVTTANYSVSYGFYDAGPGIKSLTNHDQFYIYATASQHNWMGYLVSHNPSMKNAPFNRFVLPGAHDAGMFDKNAAQTLASTGSFKSYLSAAIGLGIDVLEGLSPDQLLRVIINLAFTQKDTIVGMLDLGIRYFDFRPGYNYSDADQSDRLYHQHNFIPGYWFDAFIQNICQWLQLNPSEIVVVALGHSGFSQDYMKATPQTLWNIIKIHLDATQIGIGSKQDLASSYAELIQANKRLIVLGQYGFKTDSTDTSDPVYNIPIWDTSKYDSYTDAYQTTDVNVILNALNAMDPAKQADNDYTVLQLQGTASGASGGLFDSIATLSDASSPLMSTKAGFDNVTYPWIQANGPRFSKDQLLVCLNDFADNALTDYCYALSQQRAGL